MPEKENKRANSTSEELLSELLIANHNLESALRKIHEFGRTDELDELYHMFEEHYDEVKKELFRRLDFYERCKK